MVYQQLIKANVKSFMCDVLMMDVIKVHAKFSPIASRRYAQFLYPDRCILPLDGYSLPLGSYILCLDRCGQRWVSGAVVRVSDFQAGGPQFKSHCCTGSYSIIFFFFFLINPQHSQRDRFMVL